jgi:hypothetical protein
MRALTAAGKLTMELNQFTDHAADQACPPGCQFLPSRPVALPRQRTVMPLSDLCSGRWACDVPAGAVMRSAVPPPGR